MTGPDHFREAEVMAQRAEGLLTAGDPENLASVWAAISQAHATPCARRSYRCADAERRAGLARRRSHPAQRRDRTRAASLDDQRVTP